MGRSRPYAAAIHMRIRSRPCAGPAAPTDPGFATQDWCTWQRTKVAQDSGGEGMPTQEDGTPDCSPAGPHIQPHTTHTHPALLPCIDCRMVFLCHRSTWWLLGGQGCRDHMQIRPTPAMHHLWGVTRVRQRAAGPSSGACPDDVAVSQAATTQFTGGTSGNTTTCKPNSGHSCCRIVHTLCAIKPMPQGAFTHEHCAVHPMEPMLPAPQQLPGMRSSTPNQGHDSMPVVCNAAHPASP